MEGQIIRKYREIFSRIPKNPNTIKDIMIFMEDENIQIENDATIRIHYCNLLQKTQYTDWLRSRGVRHHDIIIKNDNYIFSDISFCSYFQCVIEYVLFLQSKKVEKDFFYRSIYSTENSRNILTEKKYKYSGFS